MSITFDLASEEDAAAICSIYLRVFKPPRTIVSSKGPRAAFVDVVRRINDSGSITMVARAPTGIIGVIRAKRRRAQAVWEVDSFCIVAASGIHNSWLWVRLIDSFIHKVRQNTWPCVLVFESLIGHAPALYERIIRRCGHRAHLTHKINWWRFGARQYSIYVGSSAANGSNVGLSDCAKDDLSVS